MSKMSDDEMCPCGCGMTRSAAIHEVMRGPAALNSEQAEALIDRVVRSRVAVNVVDDRPGEKGGDT